MLMHLATVWRCAGHVSTMTATRRLRMEENPLTIPDLPEESYNLMCDTFAKNHPQDFGLAQETPHDRFLARLDRDLKVGGIVPDYALGWVRLKSEKVTHKPGFGSTPEQLLKMQQLEEPATVFGADDVKNRIVAYYKAPPRS